MARIVFDLDGTLIDSARDIRALANRVLATVNARPITLEQTRQFVGNGAPRFVERMCAASGVGADDARALLGRFLTGYSGAVGQTDVFPYVPEALAALRADGHRLAVCTNKPFEPARAVMAHLKLDPYFECIVGGDTLPTVKPDPAPLNHAFDALGSGPMIFVGDSDVDAETAQRATVPFLLFTKGYVRQALDTVPRTADFNDFRALRGLIEQCLERTAG